MIIVGLGAVLAIGLSGYVFLSKHKPVEISAPKEPPLPEIALAPAAAPATGMSSSTILEKKVEFKPTPLAVQKV